MCMHMCMCAKANLMFCFSPFIRWITLTVLELCVGQAGFQFIDIHLPLQVPRLKQMLHIWDAWLFFFFT